MPKSNIQNVLPDHTEKIKLLICILLCSQESKICQRSSCLCLDFFFSPLQFRWVICSFPCLNSIFCKIARCSCVNFLKTVIIWFMADFTYFCCGIFVFSPCIDCSASGTNCLWVGSTTLCWLIHFLIHCFGGNAPIDFEQLNLEHSALAGKYQLICHGFPLHICLRFSR